MVNILPKAINRNIYVQLLNLPGSVTVGAQTPSNVRTDTQGGKVPVIRPTVDPLGALLPPSVLQGNTDCSPGTCPTSTSNQNDSAKLSTKPPASGVRHGSQAITSVPVSSSLASSKSLYRPRTDAPRSPPPSPKIASSHPSSVRARLVLEDAGDFCDGIGWLSHVDGAWGGVSPGASSFCRRVEPITELAHLR